LLSLDKRSRNPHVSREKQPTKHSVNIKDDDAAPPDLAKFATIWQATTRTTGEHLTDTNQEASSVAPYSDVRRLETDDPQDVRDKAFSDKKTEMVWDTTEDGQAEVALEWELKRIEKMVSAINAAAVCR
jgi:hypothetical protein